MKSNRFDKEIAKVIKENYKDLFTFEYAPNGVVISYNKGGGHNEAIFDLEEKSLNIYNKDNLPMFEEKFQEIEKNPSFHAGVIAGLLMGL